MEIPNALIISAKYGPLKCMFTSSDINFEASVMIFILRVVKTSRNSHIKLKVQNSIHILRKHTSNMHGTFFLFSIYCLL